MFRTPSITLKVPRWKSELEGLKIAVFADLHIGSPYQTLEKLDAMVAAVNGFEPDVALILGDLVIHGVIGGSFVPPEPIAERLSRIKTPLGTYAVLGNHDWWYDGARVSRALSDEGIIVLENSSVTLRYKDAPFTIAGIGDYWTGKPDIEGTLQKITGTEPIILITHNPDIFPAVPSRVSLTLAGHTHGGQVNLPVVGRPVVPSEYGQRFAFGHIVEGGRHLFVSGGTGTSILPVRFRVPPEVQLLTIEGLAAQSLESE